MGEKSEMGSMKWGFHVSSISLHDLIISQFNNVFLKLENRFIGFLYKTCSLTCFKMQLNTVIIVLLHGRKNFLEIDCFSGEETYVKSRAKTENIVFFCCVYEGYVFYILHLHSDCWRKTRAAHSFAWLSYTMKSKNRARGKRHVRVRQNGDTNSAFQMMFGV